MDSSSFDATLYIDGNKEAPIAVEVDLTDDNIVLRIGEERVADWSRDHTRVTALSDGFHLRAEGERVVLDVTEDARFALELGLRNAHPALRRRMAAMMRDSRPSMTSSEIPHTPD